MPVRLIAAAVVLALALAGCGGGGPSRREAVSSYIEQANTIQSKLAQPALTVADASRELAKPHPDRAGAERKLRGAARQIDALRRRLAALTAPADARRLRSLALESMRRQAALAREVAAFAAFLPRFETTLGPLAQAGARLKKALSVKRSFGDQAAVFDAYGATIGAVLGRLHAIRPPPVSAPLYAAQVRALERARSAATSLSRALRRKQRSEIPQLLHRFQQAAVSNQSLAVQRAQVAAIRAYNRRVRDLDDLANGIYRERARLQKALA